MRIGILTCSSATQDLGCSSVSCLNDVNNILCDNENDSNNVADTD